MLKKSLIISCVMIGTVVLALASSGGGNKKKSLASSKQGFTAVKASSRITLKAGSNYTGSFIYSSQRNKNTLSYNTLVTYQKGNTIFILPYKYKLNTSRFGSKTNINALDLRLRLRK